MSKLSISNIDYEHDIKIIQQYYQIPNRILDALIVQKFI